MTTAVVATNTAAVQAQSTKDLAASWINFVRKSDKTRKTYEVAIRQWVKYCTTNNIARPNRNNIYAFLDGLVAAKKSASTVNLYSVALRLFYRWTADEGLYSNIGEGVKVDSERATFHKKSALTAKQGGELIKSVDGTKLVDKRNKAIIALAISAALRTIELHRADIGDFEFVDDKIFLRVMGKGRKSKAEKVLVASQVYNLIVEYLASRGFTFNTKCNEWIGKDGKSVGNQPLFAATRRNKDGRLSTQSISKMIKRQLRGIGLDSKRYSAHSLRHAAAVQMVMANVPLHKVQAVLRHAQISTTMIYVGEVERLTNTAEQTAADAFFANI